LKISDSIQIIFYSIQLKLIKGESPTSFILFDVVHVISKLKHHNLNFSAVRNELLINDMFRIDQEGYENLNKIYQF
jgi:hypothetical protein